MCFYTAYGHDQRTWSKAGIQKLLKSGILRVVGEEVRSEHEAFISNRTEKKHELREEISNCHRVVHLPGYHAGSTW